MANYHNIGTSTDWIVMLVYFAGIMIFGSYFGRYTKTTADFFFGGRRFSWWLITMSIVATGVGSHSFIKYSAKAWEHGFSSTMTYMNDWFFVPFFMFGWLPILVYSKVQSIPEYFEKRFSPSARFLATILLLLYMIGYIGIGFLTMGKALLPMLPESFNLLGTQVDVTLMRIIILIAVVTGIYITFGGQTAVIFTDLIQGAILLFAGLLLFGLGIAYLGGFETFWNLLPTSWKLPLADFNQPSSFNFVGIFWQDGVAGSIGFLFMNQGLIMRFLSCRSVEEGRKAAAINILFFLPISAIVVGNAGWIGKAISVAHPELINSHVSPDQIFVVVSSLVARPGVFGFVMAALTAALMSTVDTLINATAAIFINDVYRPMKKFLKNSKTKLEEDKNELFAARISSVVVTALGVWSVIPFEKFPTVYEAHGFFHSTLTPPLVVAIFFGVFWKRFSPAAVITTFLGGVALMVLGDRYPALLIAPFDHGIPMDAKHPYSYIRALYNTLVCVGVGTIATWSTGIQMAIAAKLKGTGNRILGLIAIVLFFLIITNALSYQYSLMAVVMLCLSTAIVMSFYLPFNEPKIDGYTSWSIARAKEYFKGSKPNETEGKKVLVHWKLAEGSGNFIRFSGKDMQTMSAREGDLVYLCDNRKWLGGLKSVHSVYGPPHNEDGVVYIHQDQLSGGIFDSGKILFAEKEM